MQYTATDKELTPAIISELLVIIYYIQKQLPTPLLRNTSKSG